MHWKGPAGQGYACRMQRSVSHPGSQAPDPGWNGHAKGSRAYGRIILGLAFAGVATFAQLYSTQAVLPILASDLKVTAAEAALTISLATVGLAVTVIPWSFLADRIGRVKAMAWGITVATVLGLMVPLAGSFQLLLALRLLEGMALDRKSTRLNSSHVEISYAVFCLK